MINNHMKSTINYIAYIREYNIFISNIKNKQKSINSILIYVNLIQRNMI